MSTNEVTKKHDQVKDSKTDLPLENKQSSKITSKFECFQHIFIELPVKSYTCGELRIIGAREIIMRKVKGELKLDSWTLAFWPEHSDPFSFKTEKTKKLLWESFLQINFSCVAGYFSFSVPETELVDFLGIYLKRFKDDGDALMILSLFKHRDTVNSFTSVIGNAIENLCLSGKIRNSVEDLLIDMTPYEYSLFYASEKLSILEKSNEEYSLVSREQQLFKVHQNGDKMIQIKLKTKHRLTFKFLEFINCHYYTCDKKKAVMKLAKFDVKPVALKSNSGLNCAVISIEIPANSEAIKIFNNSEDEICNFTVAFSVDVNNSVPSIPLDFHFSCKIRSEREKTQFSALSSNPWKHHLVIFQKNTSCPSSEPVLISYEIFDQKLKFWQTGLEMIFGNKHKKNNSNTDGLKDLMGGLDDDSDLENQSFISGLCSYTLEMAPSLLDQWGSLIKQWLATRSMPANFNRLIKQGIPADMRVKVWFLLCNLYDDASELRATFHQKVDEPCKFEKVISRDINRTFTGHEHFANSETGGQRSLSRVCTAYANYDLEVGYFQNFSYIAANLLLHVDEETAFVLFVMIMQRLKFRDLVLNHLRGLHSFRYIFNRLLMDQAPSMCKYFKTIGLDSILFIPQWFLTIFSSKFPLGLVDIIFDLLFVYGSRSLITVAISILKLSAQELLEMNFDQALKYLSFPISKKFMAPEKARSFLSVFHELSVSAVVFEQLLLDFKRYEAHLSYSNDDLQRQRVDNFIAIEYRLNLESEQMILKKEDAERDTLMMKDTNDTAQLMSSYQVKIQKLEEAINNNQLTLITLQEQDETLQSCLNENISKSQEIIVEGEGEVGKMQELVNDSKDRIAKLTATLNELILDISTVTKDCQNCSPCARAIQDKYEWKASEKGGIVFEQIPFLKNSQINYQETINSLEILKASVQAALYNNM